jgi:RIO kinase 2
MGNVEKVFKQCIDCIVKFAQYGLIHGDFNEFNIIVSEDEKVTVIDFPQMVKKNKIIKRYQHHIETQRCIIIEI